MSFFNCQKATPQLLDSLIKPITSIKGKENEGFLITAGCGTKHGEWNTMTANWGGIGHLWRKLTAFIFIRPTRYTVEFAEREDYVTLSFFNTDDEKIKKALHICGTASGRDIDKAKEAGLTPVLLEEDAIGLKEAETNLVCRKLYKSVFDRDLFLDPQIIINNYPQKDFHYVYICEIRTVYTKKITI